MKYTISELKQEVFKEVYSVYDIFRDFFGEERVDLQITYGSTQFRDEYLLPLGISMEELDGTDLTEDILNEVKAYAKGCSFNILVWWPSVKITNENDKFVIIYDLYAKVPINIRGNIPVEQPGFTLLKATFTESQLQSGYVHSHVHILWNRNREDFSTWREPCLGHGPIRQTILNLKTNSDEAFWMLFCQELSMYVTVESLSGGPYTYLEDIGQYTRTNDYNTFLQNRFSVTQLTHRFYPVSNTAMQGILTEFTSYYMNHSHLAFNYKDGMFVPAQSFFDFIIDISNCFIEWYNNSSLNVSVESLFRGDVLTKRICKNKRIFKSSNSSVTTDTTALEGLTLFTFKDKPVNLHFFQGANSEETSVTLLSNLVASFIFDNVLKVINFRYKNEHTKSSENSSGETSSTTYQKVRYI